MLSLLSSQFVRITIICFFSGSLFDLNYSEENIFLFRRKSCMDTNTNKFHLDTLTLNEQNLNKSIFFCQ